MQVEANVRVGVRVRPLSANEVAADSRLVISHPTRDSIRVGDGTGDKTFTYDHVFPSHMSQEDLFNSTAAPMIQSFLDGYNVTVLAYGQTGSGKTFTMGSETGSDNQGLIPRFLEEIFSRVGGATSILSRSTDESSAVVCNPLLKPVEEQADSIAPITTVSFLEIYGEDIYDLLQEPDSDGKSKSLALRDDGGCVSVVGLEEVGIGGTPEAMEQLRIGTQHRTTASTLMNTVSSRSHAVFTITLHQTLFGDAHPEEGQEVVSKLSFVDLAGSERLKRTGAEGQRMKEGIQINKGLLALGNVINALADEEALKRKEKVHVGYRESKLTRLLQDALGGNSQTLFLACISPAEVNISESLSTLRYANRARNIQNKPVKNTDPVQEELRKLHAANAALRLELVKEKFGSDADSEESVEALFARGDVKEFVDELNKRLGSSMESAEFLLPTMPLRLTATSSAAATPLQVTPLLTGSGAWATAGQLVGAPKKVSLAHLKRRSHVIPQQPLQSAAGEADIAEAAPTFCEDEMLDPENDMRMINKLLEMLKKDEEFDKTEKERAVDIGAVDTEIEQKEEILEQLKHNVQQYQVLLEENDLLVRELQSLEGEKKNLTVQLSQVAKDKDKAPSASSSAQVSKLQERLKSVESRLKTQTSEQKKRENAISLIRRDSARCKELETNIQNLKKAKVDMVKKQKDAQSQFKGYMDVKNRELAEARKGRQKQRLESSKLESENRKLLTMMSRKTKAHQKTEEALQKNKAHLVKLLAMRKRERQRQSVGVGSKTRRGTMSAHKAQAAADDEIKNDSAAWAPEDETIQSIKFCLVQMISNRAAKQQRIEQEQKLEDEYDNLQRQVFEEVAALNKLKELPADADDEGAVEVHSAELEEQEQRLEELVVKLDLVARALSDLPVELAQKKRDAGSASDGGDAAALEDDALELTMLSKLEAPALRTVLWSFLDGFADLEFTKHALEESLRRKEAEAKAAEAKQEKLEKQVQELRRGFHERVSILHSERIELAQAVCSPTQAQKKQGQLGALRAMNADLEEKLHCEMRQREELQEEAERLRDIDARLQVVHTSSNEDGQLLSAMEDIQTIWKDIGKAEPEQKFKLKDVHNATQTCANQLLIDCQREQAAMRELISQKNAEVQAITTVLGEQLPPPIPETEGSSSERLAALNDTLQGLEPRMLVLRERVSSLQSKVESFAKQLKAFEDTPLAPLLSQLLKLDLESLFAAGGSGVSQCSEQRLAFTAIVESWEAAARDLTIHFAEVSSKHSALLDIARGQTVDLDITDTEDLATLLGCLTPSPASETHDSLAHSVFSHILAAPQPGSASQNRVSSHDRSFMVCLTNTMKDIAAVHGAREAVAAAAGDFVETFFVAVSVRLREAHENNEQPRLSLDSVATLVSEVSSNLSKTRRHCESSLVKLEGSWASDDTPASSRDVIPEPWQRLTPVPTDATLELSEAAAQIRGGASLRCEWLGELTGELALAHEEMHNLETRLSCIHQAIQKLSARQALHLNILDLDQRLQELYEESAAFENNVSRDPTRLQDRTGKGRKELATEEAQRKQFQKSIRKCLIDLQKALQLWEQDEGCKFDSDLLSDHGKEVRNAKTEAAINGKTQLMHLESGMQVPVKTTRRSSGNGEKAGSTDASESSRRVSGESTTSNAASVVSPDVAAAMSPSTQDESVLSAPSSNDDHKSEVACMETPMRSSCKPGQKNNPFSKMVSSRKSVSAAPLSNHASSAAEAPAMIKSTADGKAGPEADGQENKTPVI